MVHLTVKEYPKTNLDSFYLLIVKFTTLAKSNLNINQHSYEKSNCDKECPCSNWPI